MDDRIRTSKKPEFTKSYNVEDVVGCHDRPLLEGTQQIDDEYSAHVSDWHR